MAAEGADGWQDKRSMAETYAEKEERRQRHKAGDFTPPDTQAADELDPEQLAKLVENIKKVHQDGGPGIVVNDEEEEEERAASRAKTPGEGLRPATQQQNQRRTSSALQNKGDDISAANIGKAGAGDAGSQLSLKYMKFKAPPEKRPLTVCIDYPGVALSHNEVREAVDEAIMFLKLNVFATVRAIQFVPRSCILGAPTCKNRWLITVGDLHTLHELMISGLNLRGEHIPVRRYDMVMQEEYQIFQQLQALEKEMASNNGADADADGDDF